jgi:hypothetical protein
MVFAALLALALLLLIVIWKGPQWQVSPVKGLNRKERFDRVNEARKTLATILGGIVLLAGGYFTWQNLKVAQEGQITDRYSKAIEQLGADGVKKMVVRLGGIYALERIADESERDHWPIMEVLCTYIRNFAPITPADEHPEPDIQAILTVLGRRDPKNENTEQFLNLTKAPLAGANLIKAHLSRANLGEAHLERAHLSGADLREAGIREANLSRADLSGANLSSSVNLSQAQIDNAKVSSYTELPKDLHPPAACPERQSSKAASLPSCEGSIDFTKSNALTEAGLQGFSFPEGNGRWTEGKEASFTCALPQRNGQRPSIISIDTLGFVRADHWQTVTVSVNGSKESEEHYSPNQPKKLIKLPVPNSLDEKLCIKFSLPARVM